MHNRFSRCIAARRTCCGDSVNWYRRTSPPACPTATMPEKGHTWHGRGSRIRGQSYVCQSAPLKLGHALSISSSAMSHKTPAALHLPAITSLPYLQCGDCTQPLLPCRCRYREQHFGHLGCGIPHPHSTCRTGGKHAGRVGVSGGWWLRLPAALRQRICIACCEPDTRPTVLQDKHSFAMLTHRRGGR